MILLIFPIAKFHFKNGEFLLFGPPLAVLKCFNLNYVIEPKIRVTTLL